MTSKGAKAPHEMLVASNEARLKLTIRAAQSILRELQRTTKRHAILRKQLKRLRAVALRVRVARIEERKKWPKAYSVIGDWSAVSSYTDWENGGAEVVDVRLECHCCHLLGRDWCTCVAVNTMQ